MFLPSTTDFFKIYGIKRESLEYAKKDCVLLHPGPMNRGVEISSDISDDKNISKITNQVTHGVAIRQAVLEYLLKIQFFQAG